MHMGTQCNILKAGGTIRPCPNPVTERIFLDAANAAEVQSVKIYSATGVLHYAGRYSSEGINVKAFPAGMFVLKISDANRNSSVFRFVKY